MKKNLWLLAALALVFVSTLAMPRFVSADTTGITFSGDIVQYMQTQKAMINTLFDSWYANVYQELSKTWLAILRTTDYQSLVCLWIFPVDSILSTLQKDKITLKTSIARDISELDNRVTGLEEKNRLQKENNVDLFEWSSYAIQKSLLKNDIDTIFAKDRWFIQAFESWYRAKIRSFIIDYAQYSTQNKDLVKTINTKISKLAFILSGYNAIQDKIATMYDAMGIGDTMDKFASLKTAALAALAKQLDPIIALKVKIFKVLPWLSGELAVQKEAAIKQYMLDMDEYFASAFQRRYDRTAYNKLVESFTKFQTTYYTNQRLNCTTVIGGASDDTWLALLSAQIIKVSANISSGIAAAQTSTSKEVFKTALLSGFQKIFNTTIIKQKVTAFQNGIKSVITNLQNLLTPTTPTTPTTTGSTDTNVLPLGFVFTKPLTLNQQSADAGALQQVLKALELYSWPINNTFTQATKDALYAYQLQKWILTKKSSASLRGLLGPATRASLNKLLQK